MTLMAPGKTHLSKSSLISAWQCPKKLHLEKHHPELGELSAQTESLLATGRQVAEVSRQIYGTEDAVEIPFNADVRLMLRDTARLIEGGPDAPIFEATFEYDDILVRVDVLLPDETGGWRAIEVKASTAVKDYYVLDCAIQDWVMRHAGLSVTAFSLAHVDNQFVFAGGGDYKGLLVEEDLTQKIRTVEPTVADLVLSARGSVAGPEPGIPVGMQCGKPYVCQFVDYCWPMGAEYPVSGLGGSKAKLGDYVALGCEDIRDVDVDNITADTQLRIHRVTCGGAPEVLDGARRTLQSLPYPRYYLDFETIAPAVPIWPGTRPYAAMPVQWSCHIDDGSGDGSAETMRHKEFLDLSGEPPMRALTEAMIACLGDGGPVLMYTSYEKTVINALIDRFPDLAAPLRRIVERLFDLHPVVKNNYYHPKMLGSWSIKAVMPTIAPQMDYSKLEGIKEGTAASDGFIEAIAADTTQQRKAELEEQLLRYCKFDTEAMVEIVRFFTR